MQLIYFARHINMPTHQTQGPAHYEVKSSHKPNIHTLLPAAVGAKLRLDLSHYLKFSLVTIIHNPEFFDNTTSRKLKISPTDRSGIKLLLYSVTSLQI